MSTASGSDPPAGGDLSWRKSCKRRLLAPLRGLLAGGLAPHPLALALAAGALVGSMPLVWGSSLLCLGAALLLRLNPLAVQVGNVAAWPLQLVLVYPYLRLGAAWFGPAAPAASGQTHLLQTLVLANGAALGAWAVTTPLLFPLLYLACRLFIATIGHGGCGRPGGQGR